MDLWERIHDRLRDIKVIDVHEHLWDEGHRLEHPGDWSGLFFHYGITALQMAGMTPSEGENLFAEGTPHADKWGIFSRYFHLAINTGYLQAVLIALRDLYGIDEVTSASMEALTARIRDAVKPGFHRWVLQERAGIECAWVNCFDVDEQGNRYPVRDWGDTELLRPVLYADSLIHPAGYALMERVTEVDTVTLDGWLAAIDAYFSLYAPQCLTVKVAVAYGRPLFFDPSVSRATAESLYAQHVSRPLDRRTARPLEDYVFQHVLRRAADYRLPMQFHTGAYAGANSMNDYYLRDNVKDLAELAIAHPECKFVAMHITYPFQDELAFAARQVSNLYAEMSWAWLMNPVAAARFMAEMLVAAPMNKLLGFGGDYSLVENAYGHLVLARRGMAVALANLVTDWGWDIERACEAGWYALRAAAEQLQG